MRKLFLPRTCSCTTLWCAELNLNDLPLGSFGGAGGPSRWFRIAPALDRGFLPKGVLSSCVALSPTALTRLNACASGSRLPSSVALALTV